MISASLPADGTTGAAGTHLDPAARRVLAITAGHRADESGARRGLADSHPLVRSAAIGALAAMGALTAADVVGALSDASPVVRRRAGSEAAGVVGRGSRSLLVTALMGALDDPDPLVIEAAAWSLGEKRTLRAVDKLATVARTHDDPRCREASVAALGAIGADAGLPAILDSLTDKPTIRRRAAVALAAFDGTEVDDALRRCAHDHDWQVREVAEILLETPSG
ncbi:MAG: HEAT repeat domain-containing protein [Acidimicrobiales bacterium]